MPSAWPVFFLQKKRGIRARFGQQVRAQELVPSTDTAVHYRSLSANQTSPEFDTVSR